MNHEAKHLANIIEMIDFGARRTILESLYGNSMPVSRIKKICETHLSPNRFQFSKGKIPKDPAHYLSTGLLSQSSLFLNLFNKVAEIDKRGELPDLLLKSYRAFNEFLVFSKTEPKLCFSLAFKLYDLQSNGEINLIKCKSCQAKFAFFAQTNLTSDFTCPQCRPKSLKSSQGLNCNRQAKSQENLAAGAI